MKTITVRVKYFHTDRDVATELDAQFALWHGLHPNTPWAEIHKYGSVISQLVRILDS